MTEPIDLKIEKSRAFIELRQIDLFSPGALSRLRSCVEQVIKNPEVQTALLFFENAPPQNITSRIEAIHGREKWERLLDEAHELFHLMENAKVSWIAVIQGDLLGWELEQALACDYRLSNFNSQFGFTHLCLIPCFGACIRLPRLIGVKNALDMLLNNRIISARKAQKMGLLEGTAHPLDLRQKAKDLAEQIHAKHKPPKPLHKYKPKRFIDKYFEIPMVRHFVYRKTKKRILRESKNFYPAPLKLLEVIKNTYPAKSLKTALKEESDAFCDLMVSPVTGNLLSLCANTEKIHLNMSKADEGAKSIHKAAVIGAGVMERGSATC